MSQHKDDESGPRARMGSHLKIVEAEPRAEPARRPRRWVKSQCRCGSPVYLTCLCSHGAVWEFADE